MKELELKLISAEKSLFDGRVQTVKLPGTEGNFSVHHNHAPLISSLKAGDVIYTKLDGNVDQITISSGFVEVLHNVVTVCVVL